MYELKDYLNAINYTKEPLLDTVDEQWEKKYPPFIVNKCVAPFPTTKKKIYPLAEGEEIKESRVC